MHILIVEDEIKVAQALKVGLEKEQYQVTVSNSGEDGFFSATTSQFDIILLDIMLPGRSGLEVLEALRKQKNETPVLILTAKDSVEDRVIGLDCGADDYLVKPFAFPELIARIRALLRRGRSDQMLRMRIADLEMDCVTRKVTRKGSEISLTSKEYDLLEYLLRNRGQIVSREMLAQDVWDIGERATPLDNVIDVHINRLRSKMDTPFETKLLRTIRGVGFILKEDEK